MPLIFFFQSFFLFFRIVYHFVGRFHLSFCNIQRRYYDSTLSVSYFLHNCAIFSINDDSFFLKFSVFFLFLRKKTSNFLFFNVQCPRGLSLTLLSFLRLVLIISLCLFSVNYQKYRFSAHLCFFGFVFVLSLSTS